MNFNKMILLVYTILISLLCCSLLSSAEYPTAVKWYPCYLYTYGPPWGSNFVWENRWKDFAAGRGSEEQFEQSTHAFPVDQDPKEVIHSFAEKVSHLHPYWLTDVTDRLNAKKRVLGQQFAENMDKGLFQGRESGKAGERHNRQRHKTNAQHTNAHHTNAQSNDGPDFNISQLHDEFDDFERKIDWDHVFGYNHNIVAECALIDMPLIHPATDAYGYSPDDVKARTMPVYVKRLRNVYDEVWVYDMENEQNDYLDSDFWEEDGQNAFWMLQGGPGAPSDALEEDMFKTYIEFGGRYDVYTMDHRGTGRSGRAECLATGAEHPWSEAGTWLGYDEISLCGEEFNTSDVAYGYSSTQAGADLYHAIDIINNDFAGTNKTYENTQVYGISYGTMWAQRYMSYSHDMQVGDVPQAEKIVLDGLVATSGGEGPNGRTHFGHLPSDYETVGLRYLSWCIDEEDPDYSSAQYWYCREYLGEDPVEFALEAINTECAAWKEDWRYILGFFLEIGYLRDLIPSFLYRMHRCTLDDEMVIMNSLWNVYSASGLTTPTAQGKSWPNWDFTPVLYYTVAGSELSPADFTSYLDDDDVPSDYIFGTENAYLMDTFKEWPAKYAPDRYFNTTPTTDSKVLYLHGDADPQTSLEGAYTSFYAMNATEKTFLEFKGVAHFVIGNSPVMDYPAWQLNDGAPIDCGFQVMINFLDDAYAFEDTACLDGYSAISYVPNEAVIEYFMGVHPTEIEEMGHAAAFEGESYQEVEYRLAHTYLHEFDEDVEDLTEQLEMSNATCNVNDTLDVLSVVRFGMVACANDLNNCTARYEMVSESLDMCDEANYQCYEELDSCIEDMGKCEKKVKQEKNKLRNHIKSCNKQKANLNKKLQASNKLVKEKDKIIKQKSTKINVLNKQKRQLTNKVSRLNKLIANLKQQLKEACET